MQHCNTTQPIDVVDNQALYSLQAHRLEASPLLVHITSNICLNNHPLFSCQRGQSGVKSASALGIAKRNGDNTRCCLGMFAIFIKTQGATHQSMVPCPLPSKTPAGQGEDQQRGYIDSCTHPCWRRSGLMMSDDGWTKMT